LRCYLLSFSHFWLATPQLVLQADWQEVWHSPQPPFLALAHISRVARVLILFIFISPFLMNLWAMQLRLCGISANFSNKYCSIRLAQSQYAGLREIMHLPAVQMRSAHSASLKPTSTMPSPISSGRLTSIPSVASRSSCSSPLIAGSLSFSCSDL